MEHETLMITNIPKWLDDAVTDVQNYNADTGEVRERPLTRSSAGLLLLMYAAVALVAHRHETD